MMQFREIFQTSQGLLMNKLIRKLRKYGYKYIRYTKKYIYVEGSIPIMLVAHLDTVHKEIPVDIFHDKTQGVLWSPQGIGADDRAGVWGILMLLDKGYRPHVLFTTDEEIGGIGASAASVALNPNVKYVIELDRKGSNDAVFYDCDNPEFTKFIESFGFVEDYGSFSDISFLCPAWGIAGVNLSTGYYGAHTTSEYLKVDELIATVDRISYMLEVENIPKKPFEYIESATKWASYYKNKDWWKKYDYDSKGKVKYLNQSVDEYMKDKFVCGICGLVTDNKDESPEQGFCTYCYDKYSEEYMNRATTKVEENKDEDGE